MMAAHEFFENCSTGRGGGKIKWKLSEVDTRALSRGQNGLIGKFKMAADDAINKSFPFLFGICTLVLSIPRSLINE